MIPQELYPESQPFQLLPDIGQCEFTASSPNEPNSLFRVAFPEPHCSCPGFKTRRNRPLNDLERYCEHLRKVIADNGFFAHPYAVALLFESYQVPHVHYEPELQTAFGFTRGKEWIKVFTYSDDGSAAKFGYSLTEDRWSYGLMPANSTAIVNFIKSAFPCGEKFYEAIDGGISRGSGEAPSALSLRAQTPDVQEALSELYQMANSIIEDNAIDSGELIRIKQFSGRFKGLHNSPELRPYFEFIQRISEDGVIDDNEYFELLAFLREIAKQMP